MEKKLPKVFVNQTQKDFKNNERIYVAHPEERIEQQEESHLKLDLHGLDVKQKIRAIFNSKNYIYKAEVEIKDKNGTYKRKIIGKNGNNLITMDNEIIAIDQIEDIRLIE